MSTGFTVRRLYYVSILFYYASVFDFPKFKNFILLYVIAKECLLPWSIRNSLQNRTVMTRNWFQSQFSNVLIHLSAASTRQRSAATNGLEHWKMQEYILIYQPEKRKKIVSTSVKVQNAGTTGEKRKSSNGKNLTETYLCQTGISGVYLLVSRKSNHRKTWLDFVMTLKKYNKIVLMCYLSIIFIMTHYHSWLVLATFDFILFF